MATRAVGARDPAHIAMFIPAQFVLQFLQVAAADRYLAPLGVTYLRQLVVQQRISKMASGR